MRGLGVANPNPDAGAVIRAIHRHSDYVIFSALRGGEEIRKAALKPIEVKPSWPVAPDDIYFTINGMRAEWANDKLCSQINAVAVDIDLHADPSTERIAAVVARLEKEWWFPKWSIIVRSGRGIWLLWLLREEHSDRSIPLAVGDYQLRATIRRLHGTIIQNLPEGIKADVGSVALAQSIRLQGSINSKARHGVVSFSAIDDPALYTVSELEVAFGLNEAASFRAASYAGRSVAASGAAVKCPARKAGRSAMLSKRERALSKLLALRGGRIREGARSNFAHILAVTLRQNPAVKEIVEDFGRRRCAPPLSAAEIRATLRGIQRKTGLTRFKSTTIGSQLEITPDENAALIEAGLGDYLAAVERAIPKGRPIITTGRRERVARFLAEHLGISKRGIAKALRLPRSTLDRDLKALSLITVPAAAQGSMHANVDHPMTLMARKEN